MEQNTLKNVNNLWNTNVAFNLEASGNQKYNLFRLYSPFNRKLGNFIN